MVLDVDPLVNAIGGVFNRADARLWPVMGSQMEKWTLSWRDPTAFPDSLMEEMFTALRTWIAAKPQASPERSLSPQT